MKRRNHPKKKGRPEIGRPRVADKMGLVTVVPFLIAGIAVSTSDGSPACGSYRRSFEGPTGLGSDDSADEGTAEGTGGRSALGVRPDRRSTVGEGEGRDNADDGCECGFHGIWGCCIKGGGTQVKLNVPLWQDSSRESKIHPEFFNWEEKVSLFPPQPAQGVRENRSAILA